MRQSWTDERLDDFKEQVNQRFDSVDRRLDGLDRRLHQLVVVALAGFATIVAALLGVIATQL
jgi:hypothetical protein